MVRGVDWGTVIRRLGVSVRVHLPTAVVRLRSLRELRRDNFRQEPERKLERETGFEPATSTLARSHSTTELFPLAQTVKVTQPCKPDQGPVGLLAGLERVRDDLEKRVSRTQHLHLHHVEATGSVAPVVAH